MPLPVFESDFSNAVAEAIVAQLDHGPATFAWLAEHAEGAFPAETDSCLKHLVAKGTVRFENGMYFRSPNGRKRHLDSAPAAARAVGDSLPQPHPADYDWRFSQRTARLLARLATKTGNRESIALFGVPTVYLALLASGVKVRLYEKNAEMVECLPVSAIASATEADLLGFAEVPSGEHSVVVADPPWYPEYYRSFAQHAAAALRPGGVLLLSLLPRLTRPGASAERREVLEWLFALGFELCGYHPAKLVYLTPPFEQLSLRSEGLSCGDWRRGDLGIFRLTDIQPRVEQVLPLRVDEPIWKSFRLPKRRIRIRRRFSDVDQSFWFRPLGSSGAVLPTVSRRHFVRDKIDIWSDLNEAWEVSRVDVVERAMELLEAGQRSEIVVDTAGREFGLPLEDLGTLQHLLITLLSNNGVLMPGDGRES